MESMAQMLLVTTENNIDPSTGKKKKKNTWTELVFFPLTEISSIMQMLSTVLKRAVSKSHADMVSY